jgi:hypothetical protein
MSNRIRGAGVAAASFSTRLCAGCKRIGSASNASRAFERKRDIAAGAPLGHGPGLEHAIQFKAKIIVEPGGIMLLNNKAWTFGRENPVLAARLHGPGEIPLCPVL